MFMNLSLLENEGEITKTMFFVNILAFLIVVAGVFFSAIMLACLLLLV